MQPFLIPLSPAAEKEYLENCRLGDRTARHALIEHNLRLVAHIVKKYGNSTMEQEDMMSAGIIGLCKAIDTYDCRKGKRLVTYASRCIENEILMLLRQERKTSRETSLFEPLGNDKDGNEMTLLDILETVNENVEEEICRNEQVAAIPAAMERVLTEKEKQLLVLRYGLQGQTPKTQKEVGEIFQISRSYVSRMEKKALAKLRGCIQ